MKDLRDVLGKEISDAEQTFVDDINAAMERRAARVHEAMEEYTRVYDERMAMLAGLRPETNPAAAQEEAPRAPSPTLPVAISLAELEAALQIGPARLAALNELDAEPRGALVDQTGSQG